MACLNNLINSCLIILGTSQADEGVIIGDLGDGELRLRGVQGIIEGGDIEACQDVARADILPDAHIQFGDASASEKREIENKREKLVGKISIKFAEE